MKHLLKSSLIFLGSLVVVYLALFAVLFFIQPGGIPFIYRATQGNLWEGGGTWIKFQKFNKEEKWDVIVLGSSHAYRGYDPEIFKQHGYKMYNLGTSNQHMMCTYFIAKNYLNKDNCKLLILDIYDKVFSNNHIESKSDLIQNVCDDKTALQTALASDDLRAINMIALRYFNKLEAPLNHDTAGYTNGYKVAAKFLDPRKKDEEKMKWTYSTCESQVKYLDKLLAYCKEAGIPVVVAEHPLPAIYTMRHHEYFLKDVEPIFKRHGVPFYDYMNAPGLTGIRMFSDPTHLNHISVPIYNNLLIRDLQRDKRLPLSTNGTALVQQPDLQRK